MNVACYTRASRGSQDPAAQIAEVERVAAARGRTIDHWYTDQGESGAKTSGPPSRRCLPPCGGGTSRPYWAGGSVAVACGAGPGRTVGLADGTACICCAAIGGSGGARGTRVSALDVIMEYDNLAKRLKSPGSPGRSSTSPDGMAFQRRTSTRHGTTPNAETWQRRVTQSTVHTT